MMAALESQSVVPFTQTLPASVAMDIQARELEQDNSNHTSSNSNSHHYNGDVILPGPSPNGLELGTGVGQSQGSLLQDSTAAATGECGGGGQGDGGSVGGAECWPQCGMELERRRGGSEAEVGDGEGELGISLASEAAEGGGNGGQLPFSKQLITFSLFGKMPLKSKRPWTESLSVRIAEVQEAFKNIPQMLYFSPSSISLDGIGVYAAETLPKETLLGPYLGKTVRKELVDSNHNNQWLWEVHEEDSLSYFIDARDPKYGNWMNFIQPARHSMEQNLRVVQYGNNLYFVATADIRVGDELLVWYDEDQYHLYMGLPTGFHEVTPPPLFLDHHQQQQQAVQHQQHGSTHNGSSTLSAVRTSHTSSSSTVSPSSSSSSSPGHPSLSSDHIPPPPPPPYPSCPSNSSTASATGNGIVGVRPTVGGSSYSDGASTDDSGISMDTNGGPTPPLQPTFDLNRSHHIGVCKDISIDTSFTATTAGAGSSGSGGLQPLPSSRLIAGPVGFHPPSEGVGQGMQYTGLVEGGSAAEALSWYGGAGNTVHTITSSPSSSAEPHLVKLVPSSPVADQGVGLVDGPGVWGGAQHFVESPPGAMGLLGGMLQGPLSKKQLLYGMFSRSEDGSRWHCEECKRLFSSQGSLRAHARIHTGERPYQCQYCFRTFCQASTLRSHERLHTGEKPYKCEDCGRAFTQSAGLRSHRKTHRYDS